VTVVVADYVHAEVNLARAVKLNDNRISITLNTGLLGVVDWSQKTTVSTPNDTAWTGRIDVLLHGHKDLTGPFLCIGRFF
jgi:hypothetical protein